MTAARLARLLRLAFLRNDRLAISTLTAQLRSVRWEAECDDYLLFVARLRSAA